MNSDSWIERGELCNEAWANLRDILGLERPQRPLTCPICRTGEFRYLYLRRRGRFGFGAAWYWCHSCKRFEHCQSSVPSWWVDVPNVPMEELFPEPDWLDEHWERILRAQGLQVRSLP